MMRSTVMGLVSGTSLLLLAFLVFLPFFYPIATIDAASIGPNYSAKQHSAATNKELSEMEAMAHIFLRDNSAHMSNLALARSIHAGLEDGFQTYYFLVAVYNLCQDQQYNTVHPLIWRLNSASTVVDEVSPAGDFGKTVRTQPAERGMNCQQRKGYLLWASEKAFRPQPACSRPSNWIHIGCPLAERNRLSGNEFPVQAKWRLFDSLHKRGCTDRVDLIAFVPHWMDLRVVATNSSVGQHTKALLSLNDCSGHPQWVAAPNRQRTMAFYSLFVFGN